MTLQDVYIGVSPLLLSAAGPCPQTREVMRQCLTSSSHSRCLILLATSRAVSPASLAGGVETAALNTASLGCAQQIDEQCCLWGTWGK